MWMTGLKHKFNQGKKVENQPKKQVVETLLKLTPFFCAI
jgi:hypothetical protein